MKKFKIYELAPEKLKSVSGGEGEALGKTQTAGSYSQETARDRDSKKETVEEVGSGLLGD
jgi:hypothetical protein